MDQIYLDVSYTVDPVLVTDDEALDLLNYHVDIVINERRLLDLAREIELPQALAEGSSLAAGAYQNLSPWVILLPSRHLLPETDHHAELLICDFCGDWGCWPLEARLTVEADRVIWHDFRQPHRSERKPPLWRYDGLGPFVFDRQQYEAELGKMLTDAAYQTALHRWHEWLRKEWVTDFQENVIQWARQRADIRAVALVGSWARDEARLDSDVDWLLLTTGPAVYRSSAAWLAELNLVEETWRDVDYGLAWSRQLTTGNELEVELIFAPLAWAALEPVEAGTAYVVGRGCRILYDPDGVLARLLAQVTTNSIGHE